MTGNTNIGAGKGLVDMVGIEGASHVKPGGKKPGGKKNVRIVAGVFLVFALAALFAMHAGEILVVDAPQKSDVILVLAGETDHRLDRGLELLRQGYGRKLLIDVPAGAKVYGFAEVNLAQKYADGLQPGYSVGICPIDGLSTRDESHDAEKCLSREPGARILIVTSDYHTGRARSIFQHEIRSKSFSIAAAYDDGEFGRSWWKHREWAKTCVFEWMRVAWWNAVDRWR